MREQDKHFLWSLYMAMAIIFAWKGIWEGLYEIPYINDPFVFLFLGFAMLTFSGLIFKEFDPLGGLEKAVSRTLHQIQTHPHKGNFIIKYYDKARRREELLKADQLIRIEKNTLILRQKDQKLEFFVPAHRITEVLYKGKRYWKL